MILNLTVVCCGNENLTDGVERRAVEDVEPTVADVEPVKKTKQVLVNFHCHFSQV